VFALKWVKTIPIDPLGVPTKNFVREKGHVFGTEKHPEQIVPFVD
jgi:hypothetical protein